MSVICTFLLDLQFTHFNNKCSTLVFELNFNNVSPETSMCQGFDVTMYNLKLVSIEKFLLSPEFPKVKCHKYFNKNFNNYQRNLFPKPRAFVCAQLTKIELNFQM